MSQIWALIQAIIAIPEAIKRLSDTVELIAQRVDSLRIEKMHNELNQFKLEVRQTIKDIENAKTAEERKRLSAELANRVR